VGLDLNVDESKTVEDPDFRREWISIASGDGDRIPALLYVPKGASASNRRPGIVALHPTSPLGKMVVAGEGPLPNRNYAEELARRGYVVIAPDYPSFGDYADYDFEADDYVSGTMKGIVNHRRCVDYLCSRDDVLPDRIGAIGHSLGGHNAMFLGVFDERVQVVVSSCGWNAFRDYYAGDITGWSGERYMPRLKTDYDLDLDRVPFDFHEIVGALAPRWFLSVSPLRDRNFEVTGVMRVIPEARKVYEWKNVPERLVVRHPNAEHDFPDESRSEAYAFLDQALAFGEAQADAVSPKRFTGPWDMEAFSRPPKVRWGRRAGNVQEVFYEGPDYQGHPTEVFGYYATPEDNSKRPHPAMVLVHGGGGKAFEEWARLWAERGYVALAMDTAGQGPDGNRHLLSGPSQSDEEKFQAFDLESIKDMWTYHAVAAVLSGHSLLAAQAEVDAERIGITGISWGGYLTCLVSGIDHRLKVSVPVYGCGFLDKNSAWLEPRFAHMTQEQRELWVACFDPSRYLAGVKCPILFVNGTNDFAYPLDSYQRSYEMVPSPVDLCIPVRLPHGHQQGWAPKEIGWYVDSALGNGTPPVRPGRAVVVGEKAVLQVSNAGETRSELTFTTDSGPWQERVWQTHEANLAVGDQFEALLPTERPLVFYFNVIDSRGAISSSPHVVLE
jgi:dienelactone hydrolase